MVELYLSNRKVRSIFQLLGERENDISYSVAWALAQCPSFLGAFLRRVIGQKTNVDEVLIRLQQYEAAGGFTDIEIELPGQFYVIVEAKRGWNLPTRSQIERYISRRSFKNSTAPFKHLVVLSECSQEYVRLHLEANEVAGVYIDSLSWKDLAMLAREAHSKGSHAGKRLINELLKYLGGLMTMQTLNSNWVYVVSIARGTPKGWGISWIDIVEKKHQYFHPVGGRGYPKKPPNYIAFRYYGKLQSIHHIEGYEIVTNMHKRISEIPQAEWKPHFLYKLGPAFGPSNELKTGKIYPGGRVWCMVDTLFTCDTISCARDISKKREEQEA